MDTFNSSGPGCTRLAREPLYSDLKNCQKIDLGAKQMFFFFNYKKMLGPKQKYFLDCEEQNIFRTVEKTWKIKLLKVDDNYDDHDNDDVAPLFTKFQTALSRVQYEPKKKTKNENSPKYNLWKIKNEKKKLLGPKQKHFSLQRTKSLKNS